METTTIVKETGMVLQGSILNKLEHLQKLERITQRGVLGGLANINIKNLELAGFHWIVPIATIEKFQYHASVLAPQDNLRCPVWLGATSIVYAGDIPDFALDRIKVAKCLDFKYFTIHSNEVLPVEEIQLTPIDPVIIAWATNPKIRLFPTGITHTPNLFGTVVAVWNANNELETI